MVLNELISHCVQEEERLQRDRFESVHLSFTSQNKKRKKTKGAAEGSSQEKNTKSRRMKDENIQSKNGPLRVHGMDSKLQNKKLTG